MYQNAVRIIRFQVSNVTQTCKHSTSRYEETFKKKYDFKKSLSWRIPYSERNDEWYSKFRVFTRDKDNTHSDLIKLLQSDIDVRPSAIRHWWRRKQEAHELLSQLYIPERNETLGNELAAAHFIVHRGGAVKFCNENEWLRKDENDDYELPERYDPSFIIEAIDCSGMNLYYEGLENMQDLKQIKKIYFRGCKRIDDWCVDRICGQFRNSLVELDLRDCPKITERGLGALYKLRHLNKIYLNPPMDTKYFQLTCLLLEELNPNLKIVLSPPSEPEKITDKV